MTSLFWCLDDAEGGDSIRKLIFTQLETVHITMQSAHSLLFFISIIKISKYTIIYNGCRGPFCLDYLSLLYSFLVS